MCLIFFMPIFFNKKKGFPSLTETLHHAAYVRWYIATMMQFLLCRHYNVSVTLLMMRSINESAFFFQITTLVGITSFFMRTMYGNTYRYNNVILRFLFGLLCDGLTHYNLLRLLQRTTAFEG